MLTKNQSRELIRQMDILMYKWSLTGQNQLISVLEFGPNYLIIVLLLQFLCRKVFIDAITNKIKASKIPFTIKVLAFFFFF